MLTPSSLWHAQFVTSSIRALSRRLRQVWLRLTFFAPAKSSVGWPRSRQPEAQVSGPCLSPLNSIPTEPPSTPATTRCEKPPSEASICSPPTPQPTLPRLRWRGFRFRSRLEIGSTYQPIIQERPLQAAQPISGSMSTKSRRGRSAAAMREMRRKHGLGEFANGARRGRRRGRPGATSPASPGIGPAKL